MLGSLLLACALATLNPLNAIEPISTQLYVDNYRSETFYDNSNNALGFYNVTSTYTLGDNLADNWENFPYLDDRDNYYRAFMLCNANQSPTFTHVNDESWRYGFPNECSYLYGYWQTDSDHFLSDFYIVCGGGANFDTSGNLFSRNYFKRLVTLVTIKGFIYSYDSQTQLTTSQEVYNYSLSLNDTTGWTYYYEQNGYYYANVSLNTQMSEECDVIQLVVTSYSSNKADYDMGYNDGYDSGWQNGYLNGRQDGASGYQFNQLFASIADTPLIMLRALFGFDLFGVNLLVVVMSLITGLVIFAIVKKFFL